MSVGIIWSPCAFCGRPLTLPHSCARILSPRASPHADAHPSAGEDARAVTSLTGERVLGAGGPSSSPGRDVPAGEPISPAPSVAPTGPGGFTILADHEAVAPAEGAGGTLPRGVVRGDSFGELVGGRVWT